MSEEKLHWLAGVFSAAGSMGLYKGRPNVSLANRDVRLLHIVRDSFDLGPEFGKITKAKRSSARHVVYTSGPRKGEYKDTPELWSYEWKLKETDALIAMNFIRKSDLLSDELRDRIESALDEFWL